MNSTYKLAVTKRDAMAGRDASTSGSAGENKAELVGAKYDSFKPKTKSVRKKRDKARWHGKHDVQYL